MSKTFKCSNFNLINYIILKFLIFRTCVIWKDWNVVHSFCVCLKSKKLRSCLSSSSFLLYFSGITGNSEQKNILLTIEQLKQFSYFPFAAMFYFEHVFALCMLINKNELEWFLLIICKEHPLHRSTNLFSRNHPTLCFWLIREGRQMPSTEQLAILSNWQMQPSELFYKESCS